MKPGDRVEDKTLTTRKIRVERRGIF